jgi:hypothetical protein
MKFGDAAGNTSSAGPSVNVTIDTRAPVVMGSAFAFQTQHRILFAFTEDVGPTLSSYDLVLQKLGSMWPVSTVLTYVSPTASFAPAVAGGFLEDGNYRATLSAANVTDVAGNSLAEDAVQDFFVLGADANRDRKVNTLDFNLLAGSFGQTGRIFSEGDFSYDFTVDSIDFGILVGQYGKSLPASAPISLQSSQINAPVSSAPGPAIFSSIGLGDDRDLDEWSGGAPPI